MNIYLKNALLATALLTSFTSVAATKNYDLTIKNHSITIDGVTRERMAINGSIPGQALEFTEGDEAVIKVTNQMEEPTSLHWHGLLVPALMDGVPNFNGFTEIQPNESFTYKLTLRQSGTYWYHSHSGTQEQDGIYAPLIIHPKSPQIEADRDYTIMLSEFHPNDGDKILADLKGAGHSMDSHAGMDVSDVKGYTFLLNGKSPSDQWQGIAKVGEKVRLRFINGGAASYFDVKVPELKIQVIAADGQLVEPIIVDQFRIAPGETYDVIVEPKADKAYQIQANSIDNQGMALAILAPKDGMKVATDTENTSSHNEEEGKAMTFATCNTTQMPEMENAKEESTHQGHGDMSHDMGAMAMPCHQSTPSQQDNAQSNHRNMMAENWKNLNRQQGDKVLDYKDLRLLGEQKDLREPEREIKVTLEGGMHGYVWTMDGKTAADAKPIELKYGERVRLTFVNNSMMAHPMHLHGMFMQLDNGQESSKLPNKHTVNIAPGETYSVLLTANEIGEWAFHCHLFYHMATGMMNKVVVAKLTE